METDSASTCATSWPVTATSLAFRRLARLRSGLLRIARRAVALITGRTRFEDYVLSQIMASSYDVLHCHDFPLLAVAVEAKRRRPTPLVYDAHELTSGQGDPRSMRTGVERWLERRL